MHLDTSRDVTPRARLRAAGGAPGMQEGLLEPRNKAVQVLSGSAPGKATHWGREKWLRAHVAHDPSAVAKNHVSKRLSKTVRVMHPGLKFSGARKIPQ